VIQLPATLVEAEALNFARQWIATCKQGDFADLGCPPLHPEAGGRFVQRMMAQYAEHNGQQMHVIIDLAYAGIVEAREALDDLISEYLYRHEALPSFLADYVERTRRGRSPPRMRGVKKSTNVLQDIFIVTLIMELIVVFKLHPTRSQLYKSGPSACSVAATAMTEAGLHRGGEKAAQAVWNRYKDSVLPGHRAEAVLQNCNVLKISPKTIRTLSR
jgi:hypothetical protein